MGVVHVNRSLDPDRKIFQYMSFYGLVDLLKFNQISCASTWTMLVDEYPGDWREHDHSQPHVCIVSSIGALAESLCPDEATRVSIERAHPGIEGASPGIERASPRTGAARQTAATTPPGRARLKAVSTAGNDNLCIVAQSSAVAVATGAGAGSGAGNGPASNSGPAQSSTRLLVDVKTLLAGVVISSAASKRFLDLVTTIVHENAWVGVTRAAQSMAPVFHSDELSAPRQGLAMDRAANTRAAGGVAPTAS